MAHSSRPGSSSRSRSAAGGTHSKSAAGGTRSKSAAPKKRSSAVEKFKQNAGLEKAAPERTPLASKAVHSYEPERDRRPGPSGFRPPSSKTSIPQPTAKTRNSKIEPRANYQNPFRHEERAERGANVFLHRPVAHGVVAALGQIVIEGRYADKVIERAFKAEKNMGGRDRKAFAEMVYEIVRWWRRYGYAISFDTETQKAEAKDIWKWLGAYLIEKSIKLGHPPQLPTWDEFKGVDPIEVANRLSDLDPVKDRAIVESIPDLARSTGRKRTRPEMVDRLTCIELSSSRRSSRNLIARASS